MENDGEVGSGNLLPENESRPLPSQCWLSTPRCLPQGLQPLLSKVQNKRRRRVLKDQHYTVSKALMGKDMSGVGVQQQKEGRR